MLFFGGGSLVGSSINFVNFLNEYYLQEEKHQVGYVSILQQGKKAKDVCPSSFNMGYMLSTD